MALVDLDFEFHATLLSAAAALSLGRRAEIVTPPTLLASGSWWEFWMATQPSLAQVFRLSLEPGVGVRDEI
jgi:hypothetical protein